MSEVMQDLIAKLEDNSVPEPNTGCWLWTGAASNGGHGLLYGTIQIYGERWRAHRLSYYVFKNKNISGVAEANLENARNKIVHRKGWKNVA